MNKRVLSRKIVLCLAAFGSAFLFFRFMGKAYGSESACPSWHDLIFGGWGVSPLSSKLAQLRKYNPSPGGIALFSLAIAFASIGSWIFVAGLAKERSSVSVSLGLAAICAAFLFLDLVLCSFALPICVSESNTHPLGAGSISYIGLSSAFLLLDAAGIDMLLLEKKGA